MTCIRVPNGIVCVSLEHEIVDAHGRGWLFELHSYFGPLVIGRRGGAPLATQPGPRSPFWPAFEAWRRAHGLNEHASGEVVMLDDEEQALEAVHSVRRAERSRRPRTGKSSRGRP